MSSSVNISLMLNYCFSHADLPFNSTTGSHVSASDFPVFLLFAHHTVGPHVRNQLGQGNFNWKLEIKNFVEEIAKGEQDNGYITSLAYIEHAKACLPTLMKCAQMRVGGTRSSTRDSSMYYVIQSTYNHAFMDELGILGSGECFQIGLTK